MTASARVMVPVEITASMIKSGTTIAEPDLTLSEVVWVSAGTYTTVDERTFGGSIWSCKTNHTGRTATPDVDTAYWARLEPTNRMAPFDDYANTKAVSTGSLSYVIQPGFMNGLAIYWPEGSAYSITVKDEPGGTVIASWSGDLYDQASGFYELLFAPLLQLTQLSFDEIPLAPDAEVTITISSDPGKRVAIGVIKLGDWRQFIGDGTFGGAQYGAESNRKSYTFRQYNLDGTYKTIKRASSRNVSCSVVIDAEQAMYADAVLAEIIDTAVPFEASGLPRYGYLNTLGFVSGSIRADSRGTTSINLKIEGNI
jgi:hypothetical protein